MGSLGGGAKGSVMRPSCRICPLWWTTAVIAVRRRWLAGAALVTVGWLATPQPVPVYDGVAAPDEPYRYVQAPSGATTTAPPTTATATTPVKDGRSVLGLSVASMEQGPQFSLYLPPMSMAAKGPITVTATPSAPTDEPPGALIDGNVYTLALGSTDGPVTLTDKAAIATLYLRSTTAKQPPPNLDFRASPSDQWKPLQTSRGGSDFYVARFTGPGQFAIAFAKAKPNSGGGLPVLPLVAVGALVLLVGVVVVVRLRSPQE